MIVNLKDALIEKIDNWFTYASVEELEAALDVLKVDCLEFCRELFDLDSKSLPEVICFYKTLKIEE